MTRLRAESATFSVDVSVTDGPVLDTVDDGPRRVKVNHLHYERDLATGDEFLAATGNPTTGPRMADAAQAAIPDDLRADWLGFCRMVAAGARTSETPNPEEHH